MKIYKYYIIVLFFLLSGCSKNVSDVTDPFVLSPKTFSSFWQDKKEEKTTSKKLIPNKYKDEKLNLSELIDIALLNNPLTKQSWAIAREKAAMYAQSKSKYFPELDFSSSYTRERQTFLNTHTHGSALKKHITYYQTVVNPEITLSYLIYDFGKRKSTTESYKRALFYANFMHNRTLQTIIRNVMTLYFGYQYQKKLLLANKKNLENAKISLDAAKTKLKAGIVSLDDVTQAKTKYLQTKIESIISENDKNISYSNLITSLGLPSNFSLDIEEIPKNLFSNFSSEDLNLLILKAKKFRQDYLAQKENVKYFEEKLKTARRERFPVINSNFEIGRNYYDKGIHEDYHFAASFKLSFPLFKGFFYKNLEKEANANLFQAKAILENKNLEVINDVNISYSNVKYSKEKLNCSKKYLIEAEKSFDIAIKNYKAGLNTILEVLSAQSSLEDARKKEEASKKDWYSSISNLFYSVGIFSISEREENELKNF